MTHTFKSLLGLLMVSITLGASCKKDSTTLPLPEPVKEGQMVYIDLGNAEVKPFQPAPTIDLDGNGTIDLVFGVQLVGDPIYHVDKYQFRVSSLTNNKLPVTGLEQTPVLQSGETISSKGVKSGVWYAASSVVLMEKVLDSFGGVQWNGNWLNTNRKYLAVQVFSNNQWFNGWVALTVDAVGEKIILHNAGLSKAGEMDIKAGM